LADEIVIGTFRLGGLALQLGQDFLDAVEGGEDQRVGVAGDRHAVAELAHERLGSMRQSFEARQAEESARALDRMDEAEDVAENFGVVRILLETNQLKIDSIKMLARFGEKLA